MDCCHIDTSGTCVLWDLLESFPGLIPAPEGLLVIEWTHALHFQALGRVQLSVACYRAEAFAPLTAPSQVSVS